MALRQQIVTSMSTPAPAVPPGSAAPVQLDGSTVLPHVILEHQPHLRGGSTTLILRPSFLGLWIGFSYSALLP